MCSWATLETVGLAFWGGFFQRWGTMPMLWLFPSGTASQLGRAVDRGKGRMRRPEKFTGDVAADVKG